jgi:hypothetical protein
MGKDQWDERTNEIRESDFTQETQSECAVESLVYWNLEFNFMKRNVKNDKTNKYI